jgi:hypothetical protein
MRHGNAVFVIGAAHEELVRMIASDAQYGFNVPQQNFTGITKLLVNKSFAGLTNARMQIAAGTYDPAASLRDLVMGLYLWSPATWYAGNWAVVLTYVEQWRRLLLVAGNTLGSDSCMLFHGVDVQKRGVRLWVKRGDKDWECMQMEIRVNAEGQRMSEWEGDAKMGWVVVEVEEIL